LRNAAYFQHQLPGVPTNIVFILHYWLESWDLLQVKNKAKEGCVKELRDQRSCSAGSMVGLLYRRIGF